MKAYPCCTNDVNARRTINGRQRPQEGMKPVSGNIANCPFYYFFNYSCKKVYSMTAHSWLQILLFK